jgi:hypothetical protein
MVTRQTKSIYTFAKRHKITLDQVRQLCVLADRIAEQEVHATNGDPHWRVQNREDKFANSEAWCIDLESTAAQLDCLARQLGFQGVNHDTGIYPTLMKDDDGFIQIPE